MHTDCDDKGACRPRTVVVGVDGSLCSLDALRRAVDEAEALDANVDVVLAYRPPVTADDVQSLVRRYEHTFGPGLVLPSPTHDGLTEDTARSRLQRWVQQAFPTERPKVLLRLIVRAGSPSEILLEASRAADLLVVGVSGDSARSVEAIGSTARYCTTHCRCPVLVVRRDADGDPGSGTG